MTIYREAQQQRETVDGVVLYDGPPSVSTVVVSEDERVELLEVAAAFHHLAGWTVTHNPATGIVVARRKFAKREVVRTIWYEPSDPATDGASS